MVRKSPDSRGYVPIGTIERGLDGEYWERVPRANTKGVWQKTEAAKEFQRVQFREENPDWINLKRKIKAQEKKNAAQKRKDEKEKKADEKEKKARQELASRVRLF
tara:strand:- start:5440 stop:5754 length:315 start_codon:yes stop_codon:yes gene_type:complete